MSKVLVALSGGIDSAATSLLLLREGYDVAAVTFNLSDNFADVASAQELASKLGIEITVIDLKNKFRETIVNYFVRGYLDGETPAPCSLCNPLIKWQTLLEIADKKGFDKIATGHYCRIEKRDESYYVLKGSDPVKDQSYYLWGLRQEVLSRALTPLGDANKQDIKAMMASAGFDNLAKRKESMGVCFLKRLGYTDFLREQLPELDNLKGGDAVDIYGTVVGNHSGYPFYTIGQKRGFEVDTDFDAYVIGIDAVKNRLMVGTLDDLYTNKIVLENWYTPNLSELLGSTDISIKIRGLGINPEGYCKIEKSENTLIITTQQPMYAPAKGQPAVFYIGDRVVGGGIISQNALKESV